MSIRTKKFMALVSMLALLLTGCANNQSVPDLPTSLANQGILVARVYVIGMQAMENARVNIDGVLRSSSLREGYIAIALPPGEHKLNEIRAEGQLLSSNTVVDDSPVKLAAYRAPTFIYVPGSSYVIHYTTLSVNRTFHIESGKVTNIGLMVYLPSTDPADKKDATTAKQRSFNVFALNNNAETTAFLDANYPELMSSLPDRKVMLEPGVTYLSEQNLPALRRAIAYHEIQGPHVLNSPKSMVIYGRAGTIVAVGKQAGASAPKIDVLDTGTLADVVGAIQHDERFTFLTSDARLINWDGGNMTQSPLPYRVQPVQMRPLGDNGLIAVDNRMRILSARGATEPWQNYEGAMTKIPRNDIDIEAEDEGAYVVLGKQGLPEAIQYLKAGDSLPVAILPPENKTGVKSYDRRVLVAREAGLFILFDKPDYYFWSKAGRRWETYSKPPGKCLPIKIGGDGRQLTIECDGVKHQSDNAGATWSKPSV